MYHRIVRPQTGKRRVNQPAPQAQSGGNVAEYTVSELSGAIKRALEEGFGYVRLRGEISGFRGAHASGHCYFAPEGRQGEDRGGDLEDDLRAAEGEARGGHGGHRPGPRDELSRLVEISDRHREPRAGRPRRADGAARRAQAQVRRRRPIRRGAQEAAAVPAAARRHHHLADRRRHPRHAARLHRALSDARHRLAGARAGRDVRRRGRRRHRRLQRHAAGRPHRRVPTC